MHIHSLNQSQLHALEQELAEQYASFRAQNLTLDLTRGKPSSEQLSLSDELDGILKGNYQTENGTDCRNYGIVDGIPEIKRLGADMMGLANNEVLAGGNASLTLMFQTVQHALNIGFDGPESAWRNEGTVKFACPVPGYDRHFAICEYFGIEMVPVPMTDSGPDMTALTQLVSQDSAIKGIWCVPKYANPTGIIYSDEVVNALAELPKVAGDNFKIFWDNAYAVHDLVDNPKALANIMDLARAAGTENAVLQFCSTSKITHAGAGVAFLGTSPANLASFSKALGISTIGPDKVNQLRHARFFPDHAALQKHMQRHAAILKPRFDIVLNHLKEGLKETGMGQWENPEGGYFVSFDTLPGLAKKVVQLAADAGVKLTPAGATFPYGNDPQDTNIRIAPSVPGLDELEQAMQIFVLSVKLASVQQALASS